MATHTPIDIVTCACGQMLVAHDEAVDRATGVVTCGYCRAAIEAAKSARPKASA